MNTISYHGPSCRLRWLLSLPGLLIPSLLFAQALDPEDDEPILMDAFEVRPIEAGAEAALLEQRQSHTFTNIISEETIDLLPDQSVGETLSRLPGVAITKDRGEAERITIRGTASRLNSVSVNGDRIGSPDSSVDPGSGERAASLTAVPSTMISSIEVMKAIPADRDADSIGGAVELKTKNATELTSTLFEAGVRYGYNDLAGDTTYSGELTYGDRFGEDGQLGVVLSLSHEQANRGVSELNYSWENDPELVMNDGSSMDLGDDFWILDDYEIMWRDVERERQGANLSVDWRASENSLFKVGAFYNHFEDVELRRRLQIRFDSSSTLMEGTTFDEFGVVEEGVVDGGRARRRVRPGTKVTEHINLFLVGEHRIEDWKIDYRISNIDSTWDLQRTRTRWEVRSTDLLDDADEDGIIDLTYRRRKDGVYDVTNPTGWLNSAAGYEYGNRGDYRTYDDSSSDETVSAQFNVERAMALENGASLTLKSGYKGRFNDRFFNNGQRAWENNGDDLFMEDFLGANRTLPTSPFGLATGIWGDQSLIDNIFVPDSEQFEFDGDSVGGNYSNDEEIHAGYLMAEYESTDWTVNAGVRYEKTKYSGSGFVDTGAADLVPQSVSASYDNLFPSIIVRRQLGERTVLRGAWTNSIGRPNFSDLAPRFEVDAESDDDDPTRGSLFASGGNPELKPFESVNFDVGIEHYLESGGVLSAFVFQKTIENLEYTERIRETDLAVGDVPDFLAEFVPGGVQVLDTFSYARRRNGEESELLGLELVYQQKLSFLPAPFDNLGLLANGTWVDGESNLGQGVTRDFLIEQFEEVYNLQLYYETDIWSARLAYNHNGKLATAIATGVEEGQLEDDPINDNINFPESTLDFSFQYRLPYGESNMTFFFDVKNVLDDVARDAYYSSTDFRRPLQTETSGRFYFVGMKFEL